MSTDLAGEPIVGLVVVSHSRPLARAAVALAAEMVHGRSFRVAVAAGLDESTFGTDAVQIKAAVEEMDGPRGVVVLMDLGSAVLSAELALDLIEDAAVRDRVVLCPAPLVEGLVVAAVAAAGGASAAEVATEARSALMGKAAHLSAGQELEPSPGSASLVTPAEVIGTFTVLNAHGLHARPAARLVAEVRGLDAVVRLRNLTTASAAVPAASLSRVATLAALRGHQVEVQASGRQAHDAVEHLLALAARRFDEPAATEAPPDQLPRPGAKAAGPNGSERAPDGSSILRAGPQPASPGIGIGPARRVVPEPALAADDPLASAPPPAQWRRVVEAVADVRREVERLRAVAAREAGQQEAGIFDAHLMLLGDTELLADVRHRINDGEGAAVAWDSCVTEVEAQWAALPDPYLRARAEDVRAVGNQVLRGLTGATALTQPTDGVLVARTLTAAHVAELDRACVDAIVLVDGSPTSHVAILARARGIPAVVGAGADLLGVDEGTTVIVDGDDGTVIVDPAPDILLKYRERAAEAADAARADLAEAARPAATRDGAVVDVAANIGSLADAMSAVSAGADGVGLLRTEFLFLGRDRAPDATEQEHAYRAIAAALAGRPLTVRTLDVGGDKPLPYLPLPPEDNPFLGLRGIRLALQRPQLLADQLTALCRTAADHPIGIMFPMVSTLDELVLARHILAEVSGPDGPPPGLRVGMMVEVPSAALSIRAFLPHLDFVSIGTNDLTQYTLAVERGNSAVAALADALDPAVLRLVAMVCRAASGRVPVAVCGEAASDPLAIPVLLGLGVSELSVSPHAVPAVKRAVRGLELLDCADVAARALEASGPAEVREIVRSVIPTAAPAAR